MRRKFHTAHRSAAKKAVPAAWSSHSRVARLKWARKAEK